MNWRGLALSAGLILGGPAIVAGFAPMLGSGPGPAPYVGVAPIKVIGNLVECPTCDVSGASSYTDPMTPTHWTATSGNEVMTWVSTSSTGWEVVNTPTTVAALDISAFGGATVNAFGASMSLSSSTELASTGVKFQAANDPRWYAQINDASGTVCLQTMTESGDTLSGCPLAVTKNVTTNALVLKGNTEPPVAPGSAWAWYDTAAQVIIVESPTGSGIQFYTGNTLMFNYDQFASLFEVSGVGLTAPSLLTRGTLTVGSAGAANVAVDVPFTATGMEIFPGGAVIGQFEATTPVSVKGGPTTCTYTNSDCRMSGNAVANVSAAMWACACNAGNIYIYGQCGASTCAQTTGISFNGWVTRHN